jgi:predicted nucleotidyltransferase
MGEMNDDHLRSAVQGIVDLVQPEAVLLYGSRARGDHDDSSDWDLFVVLPDEIPAGAFTPSKLRRAAVSRAQLPVHVVACRRAIFQEKKTDPNSLSHDVARDGVVLYGRLPE